MCYSTRRGQEVIFEVFSTFMLLLSRIFSVVHGSLCHINSSDLCDCYISAPTYLKFKLMNHPRCDRNWYIEKSIFRPSIFKSSSCIWSWICACMDMYTCRGRKRLKLLNTATTHQNLILHTTYNDKQIWFHKIKKPLKYVKVGTTQYHLTIKEMHPLTCTHATKQSIRVISRIGKVFTCCITICYHYHPKNKCYA